MVQKRVWGPGLLRTATQTSAACDRRHAGAGALHSRDRQGGLQGAAAMMLEEDGRHSCKLLSECLQVLFRRAARRRPPACAPAASAGRARAQVREWRPSFRIPSSSRPPPVPHTTAHHVERPNGGAGRRRALESGGLAWPEQPQSSLPAAGRHLHEPVAGRTAHGSKGSAVLPPTDARAAPPLQRPRRRLPRNPRRRLAAATQAQVAAAKEVAQETDTPVDGKGRPRWRTRSPPDTSAAPSPPDAACSPPARSQRLPAEALQAQADAGPGREAVKGEGARLPCTRPAAGVRGRSPRCQPPPLPRRR